LTDVDLTRPWFAALDGLREVARTFDPIAELNRRSAALAVTTASRQPVVFVDADDAPAGIAYEAHIAATGRVPTRLNRHDLFSALVWLAFPRTKARLNALQAEAIARDGVGAGRGALRDASTLFDENGVVLIAASPPLANALRMQQWREAFVGRRDEWRDVRVLCFGHALMDKLIRPYKAITAHARLLEAADADGVDATLARSFDRRFTAAALTPLPVLGIPGWWPANADPAFYEDRSVFRVRSAARSARQDLNWRYHA